MQATCLHSDPGGPIPNCAADSPVTVVPKNRHWLFLKARPSAEAQQGSYLVELTPDGPQNLTFLDEGGGMTGREPSLRTADGTFDGDGASVGRSDRAARRFATRAAIVRSMNGAVPDVTHDGTAARRTGFGRQLRARRGVLERRRRSGLLTWLRFGRRFRRALRPATAEKAARDEQGKDGYSTHDPCVGTTVFVSTGSGVTCVSEPAKLVRWTRC
jgi:hypothetical protein